jgi:hypothetical protein
LPNGSTDLRLRHTVIERTAGAVKFKLPTLQRPVIDLRGAPTE